MPWDSRKFFRIPSLTWQCSPQIEAVVASAGPSSIIIDLGAGGRRIAPNVIAVDALAMPGTNLVCNVEHLPFRDNSVDLLTATGLLEHVNRDDRFLEEVCRVVKPEGSVYIEIPFLQQYHEDPIDCRRLTLPGLRFLLQRYGLQPIDSGFHIGPSVTVATLIAHYLALWFEGRGLVSKILSNGMYALASVLLFPMKFLDRFLAKRPGAHRLAFGVYCHARKPATVNQNALLAKTA